LRNSSTGKWPISPVSLSRRTVLPIVPIPAQHDQRALLPVRSRALGEAGVDRGLVGHVDRAGDSADLRGDLRAALLVEVEQRDPAPLGGERTRARLAEPGRHPGHHRGDDESIFIE
jgi:hypothetical protein